MRDLKEAEAFDVSSDAARIRNAEMKRDGMIVDNKDISKGIKYVMGL
jgi:hypothetical protein